LARRGAALAQNPFGLPQFFRRDAITFRPRMGRAYDQYHSVGKQRPILQVLVARAEAQHANMNLVLDELIFDRLTVHYFDGESHLGIEISPEFPTFLVGAEKRLNSRGFCGRKVV